MAFNYQFIYSTQRMLSFVCLSWIIVCLFVVNHPSLMSSQNSTALLTWFLLLLFLLGRLEYHSNGRIKDRLHILHQNCTTNRRAAWLYTYIYIYVMIIRNLMNMASQTKLLLVSLSYIPHRQQLQSVSSVDLPAVTGTFQLSMFDDI